MQVFSTPVHMQLSLKSSFLEKSHGVWVGGAEHQGAMGGIALIGLCAC